MDLDFSVVGANGGKESKCFNLTRRFELNPMLNDMNLLGYREKKLREKMTETTRQDKIKNLPD